jgi:hypothetical protein
MAGFRIEGNISGNVVEVDTGSNLKVNLGKDTALTGYAAIMSENDDGAVTGTPYLLSPETTDDFRLRVGTDTLLMSESFNYTAQNSGVFKQVLTTMTITYATGLVNLNAGLSTTINTQALFQTWRTFPLTGAAPTYFEWTALYVNPLTPDNVMEIGAGIPSVAAAWTLNDGVAFRFTAAGTLVGVIANNGSESLTSPMPIPEIGVLHRYVISVSQQSVDFWVDDVLLARLDVPGGTGSPCSESALPAFCRIYNTAAIVGSAQVLKLADLSVSLGDWNSNKPWSEQMAGAGLSSIQGAGGMPQGSTANYPNNVAPSSITLSNTAAGYATLGGQWQFVAIAGGETDYIVFGYQSPPPGVALTGRSLFLTGVCISSIVTGAAVATTAMVFQWSIAVGSNTVTLVGAADGAATKIPRRKTLGLQAWPIGAAIGAMPNPPEVVRNFATPLVVNAGEYVQIILKIPIGTLNAAQILRGVCSVTGYWE